MRNMREPRERRQDAAETKGRTDCAYYGLTSCSALKQLYCTFEDCGFFKTPQQWREEQIKYPGVIQHRK